jgi:hypothetical protein
MKSIAHHRMQDTINQRSLLLMVVFITLIKIILNNMTQKDKELIRKFCEENLHTHTDWTGTYVETLYKCQSVGYFVNELLNYIEEHE